MTTTDIHAVLLLKAARNALLVASELGDLDDFAGTTTDTATHEAQNLAGRLDALIDRIEATYEDAQLDEIAP